MKKLDTADTAERTAKRPRAPKGLRTESKLIPMLMIKDMICAHIIKKPLTKIGCSGCVSSIEKTKPNGVTGTVEMPAKTSATDAITLLSRGTTHRFIANTAVAVTVSTLKVDRNLFVRST
jgi:hypothetical protein